MNLDRMSVSSETAFVSAQEIDQYLAGTGRDEAQTLEALRRTILEVVPDSDECISYGMPAFEVEGKAIAGFAAFKNHLTSRTPVRSSLS